jgi:hypothetical protein
MQFYICEGAAVFMPSWQLAHNWLTLFPSAEVGSWRNFFDGIVSSLIFGWITAVVMVSIYNRIVRR